MRQRRKFEEPAEAQEAYSKTGANEYDKRSSQKIYRD